MTRTLRSVLSGLAGVWEGTYTHLRSDGSLIEVLASRQETRLEGDTWYERIRYRAGGRSDEAIEGRSILIDDEHILFPYQWRDQPGAHVVELITLLGPDHRTRLWQRFSDNLLERLTVITEQRRPDQAPEVWL